MSLCAVFVCDQRYLSKFTKTLKMLRENGKYEGDVVLIIGDDLKHKETELQEKFNISVKYFSNIAFKDNFIKEFNSLKRDQHWKTKIFQYHKFNIFDVFFKKWDYIFYIDCGINIFRPVQPIIDSKIENTLLARNDPWGPFLNKWSLATQFDTEHPIFRELNEKYNLLNIKSYFNTSLMLIDTNIIQETTSKELYDLSVKYPISITNDQAIIALYFICINKKWQEFKIEDDEQYYYDYKPRRSLAQGGKPYIMHKWWES